MRSKPFALKVSDLDGDRLKILGIPFGGPLAGKDTDGEFFSAKTDPKIGWYDRIPLLWHHGMDPEIDADPIGYVDMTTATKSDDGWWFDAQLDASAKYHAEIKKLIDRADTVYASSGAYPHLVKRAQSGELLVWPTVEISATTTPANLLAAVKFDGDAVAKHYKAVGLDFAAVKAKLDAESENALDDSDFAYIDKDGGRHLPIENAAHVRDAMSRFDQTTFESDDAKRTAAKKIVARAKKLGIDVDDDSAVAKAAMDASGKSAPSTSAAPTTKGDAGTTEPATSSATKTTDPDTDARSYEDLISALNDAVSGMFGGMLPWLPTTGSAYVVATFPDHCIVRYYDYADRSDDDGYWRVAYALGDDGAPVLGAATRVEQAYVPAEKSAAFSAAPLVLSLDHAIKTLGAARARTKDVQARRVKEGRALSDANRTRLTALCEQIKTSVADLEDLLTSTESPAKAASEDVLRTLEMRAKSQRARSLVS